MKLSYPDRTLTGNAEFKGNVDLGEVERRGLSVLRERCGSFRLRVLYVLYVYTNDCKVAECLSQGVHNYVSRKSSVSLIVTRGTALEIQIFQLTTDS